MKSLEEVDRLNDRVFKELLESKRNFILYIRSQKDYNKVKEIFDVDVVFLELAKSFGDKLPFFWADIEDIRELQKMGIFFAPVVLLFKEGRLFAKLEGIMSWAEYNRAVGELIC